MEKRILLHRMQEHGGKMKRKILILAFIFWGIGCFAGGYLVKANAVEMEVEMETTDLRS